MTIIRRETGQRMSRLVIHGNTVYMCGQVAKDSSADIAVQTGTMLERVDALLLEAGSDRYHILSATIYIKDMADFSTMNEVWERWVPRGAAPARACVQATMARPELRVEISVIAALRN